MTAIGLMHYGGTQGLYNEPPQEWVRALAYYAHADDERNKERLRRARRDAHRRKVAS